MAAIAVVLAILLLPSLLAPAGSGCMAPAPKGYINGQRHTVASCGSRLSLTVDSYVEYQAVQISDDEMFLGQLTTTTPVSAYLLNSSELSPLLANPHPTAPPSGWFWSGCQNRTVCQLQVQVLPSPAVYFLVLEDLGPSAANLTWTQTLVLFYTPTLAA